MNETKFFGARMEKEVYNIIDKVVQEENLDKTSAMKMLIHEGWKEINLEKALQLYIEGKISVDKAAKILGTTINEMMNLISSRGIKSEETLEEYRKGLKLLR